MHYKAIAIIDSEDKSLSEKMDEVYFAYQKATEQIKMKWEKDSFEEILNDTQNPPKEISLKAAYLDRFDKMLKNPFTKLQGEYFEDYTVMDFFSINKLLKDFENKDFDNYPEAILAPNCEWIEEDLNDKEWDKKVLDMLSKYKAKGIAVIIDCNE